MTLPTERLRRREDTAKVREQARVFCVCVSICLKKRAATLATPVMGYVWECVFGESCCKNRRSMSDEEGPAPLHQVQETIDSLVDEEKLDEGSLLKISSSLKRAHQGCNEILAKSEKRLKKEVMEFGRCSYRQIALVHRLADNLTEALDACSSLNRMWNRVSHEEDCPTPGFVRVEMPVEVHRVMAQFLEETDKQFKCGKFQNIRDLCGGTLSQMHPIPSDDEEEEEGPSVAAGASGDAADGAAAEA